MDLSARKRNFLIILLLSILSPSLFGDTNVIHIGCGDAFPPFVYKDKDGSPTGIYVDFMNLVAERQGLKTEWQLSPWHKVLASLKDETIDVALGASPSPERKKYLDFTEPIDMIDIYIYFNRRLTGIQTAKDLEGFPVGVLKGTPRVDWLKEQAPGATIVLYDSYEDLAIAAIRGKVHVFLMNDEIAYFHLIKAGKLNEFKRTTQPIERDVITIAVPKGNIRLVKLLNTGLGSLSKEDKEEIRKHYLGVNLPNKTNWWKVIIILISLIVISIIVLVWNRVLNWRVKKTTRDLEEARIYINNIIDSMPSILISVDDRGYITRWNSTAFQLTGISENEAIHQSLSELIPELEIDMAELLSCINEKSIHFTKKKETTWNDKTFYQDITIFPLVTDEEQGAVIRIDDMTREYRLEQQLQQSQKMESIGQLAGGVAHDFNNMLSAILGSAELARININYPDKVSRLISTIVTAAERAASLTQKLLTFARKTENTYEAMDLYESLQASIDLLRSSINKKINITLKNKALDTTIRGDITQLQNVFLNIGINAVHAMSDGGDLTFCVQNEFLDAGYCAASPFEVKPGNYIMVSVRDTGVGIPLANLDRIFEPFFTTKVKGEGTGLGLATVYGVIKQHQGAITVFSEIGQGTVFNVYLPLSSDEVDLVQDQEFKHLGSGTILIADDEEIIRSILTEMLTAMGYKVLQAVNGQEAVDIYKESYKDIKAVIIDMVMPVMDGRQALIHMKEISDSCSFIIASGYLGPNDQDEFYESGVRAVIKKPYHINELSQIFEEIDAKQ